MLHNCPPGAAETSAPVLFASTSRTADDQLQHQYLMHLLQTVVTNLQSLDDLHLNLGKLNILDLYKQHLCYV